MDTQRAYISAVERLMASGAARLGVMRVSCADGSCEDTQIIYSICKDSDVSC